MATIDGFRPTQWQIRGTLAAKDHDLRGRGKSADRILPAPEIPRERREHRPADPGVWDSVTAA
jgi:hypothetical protein